MIKRFRERWEEDSGQAMIMFAVLSSTLMLTLGLAVEGGNVFAQYRHMQSAADMAALVGAQDLPCSTTDTTCISTAETDACTYATNNGFSGCTVGGGSAPSANVPPTSCSPYYFIDYGNNASNPCPSGTGRPTSAPSKYYYVEVRLSQSLTIPIFNQTINLYAHAVAHQGSNGKGDYAVSILDPSTGSLTMKGSANILVEGSTFTNGTIDTSGATGLVVAACGGGWFVSGNQTAPSQLNTYATGTPTFASPSCSNATADSTVNFEANLPQIDDQYRTSAYPPTMSGTSPAGSSSYPNCGQCAQYGRYFDLQDKTWNTPTGSAPDIYRPKYDIEMFPGVYAGFQLDNSYRAYLNPGVYTFTSGFDPLHGYTCVYGSPSCDQDHCGTDTFDNPATSDGGTWYYQCSPFGFWDQTNFKDANGNYRDTYVPTDCSTCAPHFYDQSTSSTDSSKPLNGVTIYLVNNGITEHGNAGTSGGVYFAAPNPCAGTGTMTSSSVPFKGGAASGVYSYNSSQTGNSNNWLHGITTSPSSSSDASLYPSMDLSIQGECSPDHWMVWPNEFGSGVVDGQHLHFGVFARSTNSAPDSTMDINMNGASSQDFFGIIYDPKSTVNLSGAGKGANGPPWVDGQIVAWDAIFGGNSAIDVAYRPCPSSAAPCAPGPGTGLVE